MPGQKISKRRKMSTENNAENDIKRNNKKNKWNKEEDTIIKEIIRRFGTYHWEKIASKLNKEIKAEKTGRQCRERWINQLCPDFKKQKWSKKEDIILLEEFLKLGNQWSQIAKCIPGRTNHCIRNRFYSELRKKLRRCIKNLLNKYKNNPEELKIIKETPMKEIYQQVFENKIHYSFLDEDTIYNIIKHKGHFLKDFKKELDTKLGEGSLFEYGEKKILSEKEKPRKGKNIFQIVNKISEESPIASEAKANQKNQHYQDISNIKESYQEDNFCSTQNQVLPYQLFELQYQYQNSLFYHYQYFRNLMLYETICKTKIGTFEQTTKNSFDI